MSENTLNKFEQKAVEMTAVNIIDKTADFKQTEGGFTGLEYKGEKYGRVKVVRLFPFSDENRFLSIREYDSGKEIGIIEDLDNMTDASKDVILKQLKLTYFTPQITKIFKIKDEYGYAYFHVMTDKGECRFAINMGANAVIKLSDTRLIIMDVDENRFEIKDVDSLSQKERRMLDLFL